MISNAKTVRFGDMLTVADICADLARQGSRAAVHFAAQRRIAHPAVRVRAVARSL